MDPHTTPVPSVTPSAVLPPVNSGADNRALHRADAHTNICLICQLPKWAHGRPSGEALCCCENQEGEKSLTRRYTTTGHEAHSAGHFPSPIQIGQRRHSLMMARLDEHQHDHQRHLPEREYKGSRKNLNSLIIHVLELKYMKLFRSCAKKQQQGKSALKTTKKRMF